MLDDTSHAYIDAITRGDQPETDRLGAVLDTVTQLEAHVDKPADLHDAALAYAAAGIAVFPIQPQGKRPLTSHGFKDATTNPTQITEWWTGTPAANIGVPTGHLFDVVDIDGREGLAHMYSGTNAPVDSLTVLGVALTARNGGRHIYVPVSGFGNKASIYPGVDYRGNGGYVVAPPSVGANRRRYQWATPLTITAAGAA